MPPIEEKNILYVCFTHVEFRFNYPKYVKYIHMGNAQKNGRLNLRDLAPQWENYHPLLGSTAGAFAMKNLLLNNTEAPITHVGICQYRKFLTNERIGSPATNYQVMDIVSSDIGNQLDLNDYMIPRKSDFLIGKPGNFNTGNKNYGYLYQYKDVHFVEDILRFTAIAVEIGALDKNDVCLFFDEQIFLPGGIELGVMPVEFWLKHITLLEEIVKICVDKHNYKRTGFQSRSWAFCCERMGSYFLLREFRSHEKSSFDWLENHIGQLNLITENGDRNYNPGI